MAEAEGQLGFPLLGGGLGANRLDLAGFVGVDQLQGAPAQHLLRLVAVGLGEAGAHVEHPGVAADLQDGVAGVLGEGAEALLGLPAGVGDDPGRSGVAVDPLVGLGLAGLLV